MAQLQEWILNFGFHLERKGLWDFSFLIEIFYYLIYSFDIKTFYVYNVFNIIINMLNKFYTNLMKGMVI